MANKKSIKTKIIKQKRKQFIAWDRDVRGTRYEVSKHYVNKINDTLHLNWSTQKPSCNKLNQQ